ncbi:MAG: hypothetical protein HFH96_10445 [Lachnospiraceae bacterium]|nr:hypothetical protein [uncultured Acetatifactor sp.]MCI9231503.1 hypothetical protein [Lachnospiraceae bacterium]
MAAADLYFSGNRGFIRALGSNVNTLDSLDTHAVITDELGAIKYSSGVACCQ